MSIPLVAWLPAAIATAGGVFSAFARGRQAKKQRKENTRIRELEYQRYLEDFQRKSPKEDMKRYHEAGLNPNLIYGQAGGGSAGTPPEMEPDQYEAADVQAMAGPAINEIANLRTRKLTNDQIEANTHLTKTKELEAHQSIDTSKYSLNERKRHQEITDALLNEKLSQEQDKSILSQEGLLSEPLPRQKRETTKLQLRTLRNQVRAQDDQHALTEFDRTINALKAKGVKITMEILQQIKDKYLN